MRRSGRTWWPLPGRRPQASWHEIAWQLPVAAFSFFNRRTYWADWVETHRIALASARAAGDRRGEALVLNNLGMVTHGGGWPKRSATFEQALDIRREIGDRVWRGADGEQPGRHLPAR